jgi:GH43 family beta-xylosidase
MPRLLSFLAASLLLSLSATSGIAQRAPAHNPILPNADPFITLHPVEGKYLLLATTGHNITLWSGPTIPTAASTSKILFTPPSDPADPTGKPTLTELWSPTLCHIGPHWWIYFTARTPTQPHAIYALESDTGDPQGSYTFRGELPLAHPAIDPSLLTLHGVNYLMYVSLDDGKNGGENAIRIVRLASPTQPSGPAPLIAEPQYPWEKGAGTSKTYPVNEGPTALYHAGRTFIVYSASDTASPAYCLGLLTLTGEDPLDRRSWTKTPHPVFDASAANGIYGPGRGTFARSSDGPRKEQDWLLYAAKPTDDPTPAHRATRAQPFTWNPDGSPNFGVPQKDGPVFPK